MSGPYKQAKPNVHARRCNPSPKNPSQIIASSLFQSILRHQLLPSLLTAWGSKGVQTCRYRARNQRVVLSRLPIPRPGESAKPEQQARNHSIRRVLQRHLPGRHMRASRRCRSTLARAAGCRGRCREHQQHCTGAQARSAHLSNFDVVAQRKHLGWHTGPG